MTKRRGLTWALALLCLALALSSANAQWVRDGIVVCGADDHQYNPRVMSDGAGGAIVVWIDYRNGGGSDIYANRIESGGYVYDDGLAICAAPGDQNEPRLIPDGTGGAIFTWLDPRSGDVQIYAQRIDGTGTARWTADGIPICTAINGKSNVRIVPDGAGGGIIVWADYRRNEWDIYAQHVTADGDTLWAAAGMPVDTSMNEQFSVEAVSDGAGGAYLAWIDGRTGWNILFAQRIDGDGNLLWGPDAVQVCSDGTYQALIQLVAAAGGGICVSWNENRYGNDEVFVQKLDGDGDILWQADGVVVCPYNSSKYDPQLAGDGAGGAIVAWYDNRDSDNEPVYAGRVDADGNSVWPPEGVMVFPRYGDAQPRIVADGNGGIIATLDMYYVDENSPTDIYAQRIDHDGNALWGTRGAAVCLAREGQYHPELAMDGRGGAVIAWNGYEGVSGYSDIYAQRVDLSGLWGTPEPEIVSCADLPDDQGGWVRIKTRASSHDVAGETDSPIMGYNVWRMIAGGGGPRVVSASIGAASAGTANAPAIDRSKLMALLSDPATAKGVRVSGSEAVSLGLPPGAWESVGFWFATRDTVYNIAVPTKNDSTEAGTAEDTYIVTAHTSTAGVFVASEPAIGYSVDNLAPDGTKGFAGNEGAAPPGLMLSWTPNAASDLWKYNVYRGDDESFVPDQSTQIGTTEGTTLLDESWVKANMYFYKLVAVDRHGNKSPASLLRPQDVKVGTMLQSFAASLSGAVVEISWTLSEAGADTRFVVLRSVAASGAFEELDSPRIERNGLSFFIADRSVEPGMTYRYRVDVAEGAASRTLFETNAISTPAMPLTLHQNHPNPFNPSTTISYYLPEASVVTLEVYDSTGRLISRLYDGAKQDKGTHEVGWRGLDAQGRPVSSGVYFYRLMSGKETISKKMVLLR